MFALRAAICACGPVAGFDVVAFRATGVIVIDLAVGFEFRMPCGYFHYLISFVLSDG